MKINHLTSLLIQYLSFMAFFNFKNVKIVGISAGVPARVMDNLHSEFQFSTEYDNEHFVSLTGVKERRSDPALTTSDLCFQAAKRLLADLQWDPKEIDAIIMVSQTLDFFLPATACIMQDKLGLPKEAYAEDIQLGCSGWVYGISNVAALMQNGDIKKAILCAGDAKKQFSDPAKPTPLFGMAGTVTALEFDENAEGIKCHFGTDGSGYEAIITPGGGSRNPITPDSFKEYEVEGKMCNDLMSRMKGMDVFAFGISTAPKSIKKLAQRYDFDYLDADYFVFHQANMKMNEMIEKKLKLPKEKVPYCMEKFGNTSSASIPLTIVTQLKDKADKGEKSFICCGFGVGLSWGTLAFRTDQLVISPLVEVESGTHLI